MFFCCNKNYHIYFDENCKNRFANTFEFVSHDIGKLIYLLQKFVYLYEYMDDWEKPYFESCFELYEK